MRPLAGTIFGIVLFLFIPVVLYLFVAHPAPVAGSLVGGLVLMAGHRFLARPYMLAARPFKCVWCNRVFEEQPEAQPGEQPTAARAPQCAVELAQGGALPPLELLTCAAHVAPTQRFFAFVDLCRLPLRLGIGLPLGLLLGSLVAHSAGLGDWTGPATALFQLAVGLTVHLAAVGPWLGGLRPESRAAFPVHNFYLLGIRAILWIFRLVGIWWLVVGGSYWLKAAGLLP